MKAHIHRISRSYHSHFTNRQFVVSFVVSFTILLASVFVSFYASMYADAKASNYVTDIILSNTKVYDVDWAFIYGILFFWIIAGLILLNEPKRLPS